MAKQFTITFAGDTSLGDWYLKNPNRKKELDRLKLDPFSFFEGIQPIVKSSDYFILNLETVLSENPTGFNQGKSYPNFDNPTRTLSALNKLGVSAVSLANNHTMDFGSSVLMKTKNRLKEAGIENFGAGENLKKASKPLKVKLKGEKSNINVYVLTGMRASRQYKEDYGFMAGKEAPGVNSLNLKNITKQITKLRKRDPKAIIVVYPHWQGLDYKWVTAKIKQTCRGYLKAGADFVFAHGTHMANHIEQNENGTIAYSMGNFVFNSLGRYKKMQALPYSIIIKLQLVERKGDWIVEPYFYPIVTDNKFTNFNVRMVNKLESKELLNMLNSKTKKGAQNSLEVQENNDGYYFTVTNHPINEIKRNSNSSGVNLKDVIMGNANLSYIDFTEDQVFDDHIEQLSRLHNEIDENFFNYYEKLAGNKKITTNKERMDKLSEVVKKEYLSHKFVKRFERNKLKLSKAMSFKEIMAEKSQLSRLGFKEYSWKLDKKNRAYPFADSIGLRRPKAESNVYKFSEIEEPNKPVVIKPIRSTGSMGVYLVFNKTTILSAREGIYLNSWEELQADATKKLKDWKAGKITQFTKDEWMIEELILKEPDSTLPPSDLKFYCFYGEVLLVLETNRLHKNFCFWDPDMNLIDTGDHWKGLYEGTGFTKEDLNLVSEASSKIPTPFIRMDMLNGHDGLVFGEATPRPGQYHLFNSEYDHKLGEAYRMAEARLRKDLLNGKKFDEFTSNFKV
ncbi:CapA family protein [Virgibacillus oceani]